MKGTVIDIKPTKIGAFALGLAAAALLVTAFWRDGIADREGWTPVNRQLATALERTNGKVTAEGTEPVPLSDPVAAGAAGAGGQEAADSGEAAVDGGQEAVDGRQAAVGGGQEDVEGTEAAGAGSQEASAGAGSTDKVNINKASAEELDELPGIGAAKARAIVDDRRSNGRFQSVDDLERVKGIGPKMVEKLKSIVVAGP